uniref:2Fe-2S ferredoxin-type domain-containing protein n=1 Tax=Caenorhabditis tropicalis TaxID=1561998 RepID=A0A1I7TR63_9PELO
MGACSSCLRLLLDAESDVKIHVIEPTSINNGDGSSVANRDAAQAAPAPPPAPVATLQVPGLVRARTPEPTDPRVANL